MQNLHKLTFLLLLLGGLNWLLLALAGWDVSQWLGGMDSQGAKAVYVLFGLAALYELMKHKGTCKACK